MRLFGLSLGHLRAGVEAPERAARRLRQRVLSQGRLRVRVVVVVQRRLVVVVGRRVPVPVVHIVHGLEVRLGVRAGQQPRDAERVRRGRVPRRLLLQLSVVLQRQWRVLRQAQLRRCMQLGQQLVPHLLLLPPISGRLLVPVLTPLLVGTMPVPVLRLLRLADRLLLLVFKSLLPPQEATVLEHVAAVRVQRPERALARLVGRPRHFDETVVERQRMPYRVLPALLVLSVEREQVHDELVDFGQREHPRGAVLDGHGDEADVGVGRLGVRVGAAVGFVVARALQRGGGRCGLLLARQ